MENRRPVIYTGPYRSPAKLMKQRQQGIISYTCLLISLGIFWYYYCDIHWWSVVLMIVRIIIDWAVLEYRSAKRLKWFFAVSQYPLHVCSGWCTNLSPEPLSSLFMLRSQSFCYYLVFGKALPRYFTVRFCITVFRPRDIRQSAGTCYWFCVQKPCLRFLSLNVTCSFIIYCRKVKLKHRFIVTYGVNKWDHDPPLPLVQHL